jgi:urease accessory protein
VLIIQRRIDARSRCDDELVLTWELRQKSRLRTVLASGREAGLFLPRGTVLADGDCLESDDGVTVRVVAAVERLAEARCADTLTFARCAYHLGNRHTPVEIMPDVSSGRLRFGHDAVLAAMATGLGATVTQIDAPFSPEPGAYSAAHHSHSGEQRHTGIIHDHFARVRK